MTERYEMRNQELIYPGKLMVYHTQNFGDTVPYWYQIESAPEQYISVSSAPLNRGNRKDPKDWWYKVGVHTAGQYRGFHSAVHAENGWTQTNTLEGNSVFELVTADEHPALMAQAEFDSYSKLIENIRGNLDLSVDLAQAGKTASLGSAVEKSVVSLGRAIVAIKRQPLRAALNIAKLTGELRLLWIYGVKPTMQTLYQAVQESYHRMSRKGIWIKGRASVNSVYSRSGTGWPNVRNWNWTAKINDSAACEHAVQLLIPEDGEPEVARWTSLNPASIAWELLPFSFVVDWFLNVGDYLRNLESKLVYQRYFRTGYKSNRTRVTIVQTAVLRETISSGGWVTVYSDDYSASLEQKGMERVVLHAFPAVPPLRLNPQLGASRLLNAAALLSTAIQSRSLGPEPKKRWAKGSLRYKRKAYDWGLNDRL